MAGDAEATSHLQRRHCDIPSLARGRHTLNSCSWPAADPSKAVATVSLPVLTHGLRVGPSNAPHPCCSGVCASTSGKLRLTGVVATASVSAAGVEVRPEVISVVATTC
jgi:hypothetical protein